MPPDPMEAAWWVLQTIFWVVVYILLVGIALSVGWWILKGLTATLIRAVKLFYEAAQEVRRIKWTQLVRALEAESARQAVVRESVPRAITRALVKAVIFFAVAVLFWFVSEGTSSKVVIVFFAISGYRYCRKAWQINAGRKRQVIAPLDN